MQLQLYANKKFMCVRPAWRMLTILLIRNDDQFDYINKCYLCVELPGIKIRTTARDICIYLCVYRHMSVSLCVCVSTRV